jgi:hypothetical protein
MKYSDNGNYNIYSLFLNYNIPLWLLHESFFCLIRILYWDKDCRDISFLLLNW